MQSMIDFSGYILSQLPAFLMAEPVCYLVGLGVLSVVVRLFNRMIRLS